MKDYKLTEQAINSSLHFFATFTDKQNREHTVELTQEIYDVIRDSQNKISSLARAARRHGVCSFDETIGEYEIINDTEQTRELMEKLYEHFDTLTVIQRRRVEMYYFQELTLEEIARMEGTSARSILYSIKQSIKKLKKFFD